MLSEIQKQKSDSALSKLLQDQLKITSPQKVSKSESLTGLKGKPLLTTRTATQAHHDFIEP